MKEDGFERVVFETDAQQVVMAIRRVYIDMLELGEIVRQCNEILARNPSFYVQFAKRVQNKVAYEIAR
ncbi:hypothetical protein LINPERPRIM_LOCUS6732 [Linum perenne]